MGVFIYFKVKLLVHISATVMYGMICCVSLGGGGGGGDEHVSEI